MDKVDLTTMPWEEWKRQLEIELQRPCWWERIGWGDNYVKEGREDIWRQMYGAGYYPNEAAWEEHYQASRVVPIGQARKK